MSARVRGEDDGAQAQDFTDVVVRLRMWAGYEPVSTIADGLDDLAWALTRQECRFAADEIERLRG